MYGLVEHTVASQRYMETVDDCLLTCAFKNNCIPQTCAFISDGLINMNEREREREIGFEKNKEHFASTFVSSSFKNERKTSVSR